MYEAIFLFHTTVLGSFNMLLVFDTKTRLAERKRTDRFQTFGLEERGL
jgi:hypothetical protein